MSAFVGDHHPPDVVGEAALEASHGFVAGLALLDLLVEVGAPDAVAHTHLGDCDEMDCGVQSAIPSTRQPVATVLTARDLNRGNPGIGSERMLGPEPRRMTAPADEANSGHGADPIDFA